MFDEKLMKIATAVVAHNRDGNPIKLLDEVYADDAVSVEAALMPGSAARETKGLEAIRAKHENWSAAFETHSSSAEGPFIHGEDRFGVIFEADATNRATNERGKMRELGVYTVKDGKIIREEFYYSA